MEPKASKNGLIDFTPFARELVLHPESNKDYPAAPWYVTTENKFLSDWRKEIDGRAAKSIFLCESYEEAERVCKYLRNEMAGDSRANKDTNITARRPRLDTWRNVYSVYYNNGVNPAYN